MNREAWLNAMAERMSPLFLELGAPLQPYRISIGFTSAGQRGNVGAEVWHSSASADGTYEILISPGTDDSMQVSAYLAHELCHIAAGIKEGHKGPFVKLMKAIGMTGPFTCSVPTRQFEEWVQPFIDELGPLPHGKLTWHRPGARERREPAQGKVARGIRDGLSQPELEEIITTAKKKQSTRLKKVECSECGYVARVTQKWLDKSGPPHCPEHGEMTVGRDANDEQDEELEGVENGG
ncbi:TPA: hypothetical protein NII60_000284 [Pseudomonas aeruginosa]|nr:hypothetical protein [Pseudomonas aeruginosa]